METKKIHLQPKKSYHFWWYVIGILLVPIGVGIYILYKKNSEISATHYEVTDQTITAVHPTYTETIDIINIHKTELHQRWIDKQFGIGNLLLKTDKRKMELIGLENPDRLSEMILKAAQAEQMRLREQAEKTKAESESQPGTLDKLDYLTGLWQQGLITNDEYMKEKKYFEGN